MTRERLREELARIGEAAPIAHVPAGTWRSAARAHRRDRALVAGAVLAVALLAGVLAWIPETHEPPVAAGGGGAVPDRVHLAPERLAARAGEDETWARDLETDPAIGAAAVAYVLEEGLPVLVDADDGDYHLLDLPGFVGNNAFLAEGAGAMSQLPLALSPDGTRLAYAYADVGPAAVEEPVPSGVRVADLATGELREIALTGGEGVLVAGLDWSPGGTWLAWHGDELDSWTRYSLGGGTPVAGVIGPDDDTSREVRVLPGNASVSYAPADDGTVAVIGDSRMVLDDGPGASPVDLRVGDRFSVGAGYVDGVLRNLRTAGGVRGYSVHALPGPGRVDLPRELAGRDVRLLGWLDARHLVARVTGTPDGVGRLPASELAVIGVGDDPSYDKVGTFDADVPPVSVATGLMSLERPTVTRPEPDWPWSERRISIAIGLGVAATIAMGLALRLGWRRAQARWAR